VEMMRRTVSTEELRSGETVLARKNRRKNDDDDNEYRNDNFHFWLN